MLTFLEWLSENEYFTPQELQAKGEWTEDDRDFYQNLFDEDYYQYLKAELAWTPFKQTVIDRHKKRIPLIVKAGKTA